MSSRATIRHSWLAVMLVVALAASVLVTTVGRAEAVGRDEICFVFADDGDRLGLLDRSTGQEIAYPNAAGAEFIEAIELDPTTGVLYAANADELGTIDLTTGLYTRIGAFGTGSGSEGNRRMIDVDALAFDLDGTLWAVNARRNLPDELFQVNPATGAIVPGALGGADYVIVDTPFDQIDDIGIEPATGQMYGVDVSPADDQVGLIDKTTGAWTPLPQDTGVGDMEGMTFDTTGELIGVTGITNGFYTIDKTTGVGARESDLGVAGADYEGVTCLTQALDIADLSLTKTVDDAAPAVGQTVTFTIEVTNSGDDDASGVVVEDVLDPRLTYVGDDSGGAYDSGTNLWTIGDLGAGASTTLNIQATPTETGTIPNVTEVVAADSLDPDSIPDNDDGDQSEDDEDGVVIEVTDAPAIIDLELDIEVDDPTPAVGQVVTYTLSVVNQGPADATDAAVTATLPDGLTDLTTVFPGADIIGSSVTWDGIDLGIGETFEVTFQATVLAPTGADGEYTVVAEVTAADQPDVDSTPANDDGDQSEDDEDAAIVEVAVPAIGLAKDLTSSTSNGDGTATIEFLLTVENLGATTLSDLDIEDDVLTQLADLAPTDLSALDGTLTANAAWDGTGADVLAPGQSLEPGESGTVSLRMTVTPDDNGPYENQATVTGLSPNDETVTDLSQDGLDPDLDGDGDATDDNDPTPVEFGALSGRVWLDDDGDGIEDDGEDGIAGVTISLVGPGPDGTLATEDDVDITFTTTGADGDYLFTGLPAGDYIVVVDQNGLPEGAESTFDFDGGFDSVAIATVTTGETTDVDFGYDTTDVLGGGDDPDDPGDGDDPDDPGDGDDPEGGENSPEEIARTGIGVWRLFLLALLATLLGAAALVMGRPRPGELQDAAAGRVKADDTR